VSPQAAELARRLTELQAELERTQSVDPKSRELLENVQRNIESVLERSDESGQSSLRERLEAAIEHFETSHPVLTATMGRVMDQLSNLGI
jgi:predicted component of type VI protein secretion system